MAEGIDRMAERKWGVFTHYLYGVQNNPESPMNQGAGETDWNTCVDELNVDRIAKTLAEVGAGYYFFTLMQGRKYMAAPNTTFDEIAQTKPGEACSLRDLPADIHRALTPYQIDFYLYYTGDGPYKDEPEGADLDFWNRVRTYPGILWISGRPFYRSMRHDTDRGCAVGGSTAAIRTPLATQMIC